MNRHHHYREQIDACRPGQGDLSSPALAELAAAVENDRAVADELARSQRFDRVVAAAIHDVALPTGLAERLLAKLAESGSSGMAVPAEQLTLETAVAEATAAAADTAIGHTAIGNAGGDTDFASTAPTQSATASITPAAAQDPSRRAKSRRWLLAGVGSLALVTMLAVGFWQWGGSAPRQISEAELSDAGMQWFRDAAAGQWRSTTGPLQGFPVDRQSLVLPRKLTWKSLPLTSGEQAIAYNLTSSGKGQVLLFVVRTKNVYTVPTLPYKKLSGATSGVALAAWQSDGLLYVLAVEESGQRLEDVVRQPQITGLPGLVGPPSA